MELNEKQKCALSLLDALIEQDDLHARNLEASFLALPVAKRAKFKIRKRSIGSGQFLASRVDTPDWSALPKTWAYDWCEGWAYKPGYQFAAALGVHLLQRSKNKKQYLTWVQETDFDFREGFIIHSYPLALKNSDWLTQLQHNPSFLQVLEAVPAAPVDSSFKRDSGYVRFRCYKTNSIDIYGEDAELETTQDGFVRYLITGILTKNA